MPVCVRRSEGCCISLTFCDLELLRPGAWRQNADPQMETASRGNWRVSLADARKSKRLPQSIFSHHGRACARGPSPRLAPPPTVLLAGFRITSHASEDDRFL